MENMFSSKQKNFLGSGLRRHLIIYKCFVYTLDKQKTMVFFNENHFPSYFYLLPLRPARLAANMLFFGIDMKVSPFHTYPIGDLKEGK